MPAAEQEMEQNLGQNVGADVYAGRIVRTLNQGFVALMISVGHRTGLFDVMAALPPSTSGQIAATAGVAERYVREWLSAMTSGGIVHFDARTQTFFLPIEYAAVLARGAGENGLAPAAEMLSRLATIEDLVVAGFRSGGGVHSEAFDDLNAILSAQKRKRIDESYVASLLELVPGIAARLEAGGAVLDAGCGDGALLVAMARWFPRAQFRGYDLSRDAIARANDFAAEAGVRNVDFAVGDVASLDEPRAYDLVLALESIHEVAFPRLVLRRMLASLRRGGAVIVQETAVSSRLENNADHPFAPMLYALSCMHTVPVALAQEGEALGRMWGRERAAQMLAEAGFRSVRVERIAADPMSMYLVGM